MQDPFGFDALSRDQQVSLLAYHQIKMGTFDAQAHLATGPASYQDLMRVAMWVKGLIYDDVIKKIDSDTHKNTKVGGKYPPLPMPSATQPKQSAGIKIIGANSATNTDSLRALAEQEQSARVLKKLRDNASSESVLSWWLKQD